MKRTRTFQAKPAEINRTWWIVDAKGVNLGRLATVVAKRLQGKHLPSFTPHIDNGDGVIVINAEGITVTGDKLQTKRYYRHSGHAGGLKERTMQEQMDRDAARVIEHAVRGMLPDNKLRTARMSRLRIFNDDKHDLDAQQPKSLNVTEEK